MGSAAFFLNLGHSFGSSRQDLVRNSFNEQQPGSEASEQQLQRSRNGPMTDQCRQSVIFCQCTPSDYLSFRFHLFSFASNSSTTAVFHSWSVCSNASDRGPSCAASLATL